MADLRRLGTSAPTRVGHGESAETGDLRPTLFQMFAGPLAVCQRSTPPSVSRRRNPGPRPWNRFRTLQAKAVFVEGGAGRWCAEEGVAAAYPATALASSPRSSRSGIGTAGHSTNGVDALCTTCPGVCVHLLHSFFYLATASTNFHSHSRTPRQWSLRQQQDYYCISGGPEDVQLNVKLVSMYCSHLVYTCSLCSCLML